MEFGISDFGFRISAQPVIPTEGRNGPSGGTYGKGSAGRPFSIVPSTRSLRSLPRDDSQR